MTYTVSSGTLNPTQLNSVTSAVTNFRCHKLIAKVNNQKNGDTKNLFAMGVGKDIPFLSTENIKICGRTTKRRMHYAYIFFRIG